MMIVDSRKAVHAWIEQGKHMASRNVAYYTTSLANGVPFCLKYVRNVLIAGWINGEDADHIRLATIVGAPMRLPTRARLPDLEIHGVITGVPSNDAFLNHYFSGSMARMGYLSAELITPVSEVATNFNQVPISDSVFIRERMLVQFKMRSWAEHNELYSVRSMGDLDRMISLTNNDPKLRGLRISLIDDALRKTHPHPDCMLRFTRVAELETVV